MAARGADPLTTLTVEAVDWATWAPTVRATLLFVVCGGQVLLIRKKRGLGAGKINGPGGKLDPGETPLECALRETFEEVGVRATGAREAGQLYFEFVDGLRIHCTVFRADGCEGQVVETAEAVPLWTPVDQLPYAQMWADDRHWLPALLAREPFTLWGTFDGEQMLDYRLQIGG